MRKLSIFLCAICSVIAFGQKVSDYKYVFVPEKFQDFKEDFGLKNFVTKGLKAKKYIILQGEKETWPIEAKDNICSVVYAGVLDDRGFLRNKVILQFKDCKDKVLLESKGSSSIKAFEEGFQDALQGALVPIPISHPVAIEPQNEVATTQNTTVSNTSPQSTENNTASKYSNGKLEVQKVQIDNSQFILVKTNSSVPYATFKASTKKDVFRVKLENGNSTLGYFENRNIIIEIPQANGEYSKEVFSAK